MQPINTSKELEKAPGDALSEPGDEGNDRDVGIKGNSEKQRITEESEGSPLKEVKIVTPNNYSVQNLDELGPVAQDLEIERREGYLVNQGFGR